MLDSYHIIPVGAQVAHWVKRWPIGLVVPSSILARGEIFSTSNRPDLTEILLNRT